MSRVLIILEFCEKKNKEPETALIHYLVIALIVIGFAYYLYYSVKHKNNRDLPHLLAVPALAHLIVLVRVDGSYIRYNYEKFMS